MRPYQKRKAKRCGAFPEVEWGVSAACCRAVSPSPHAVPLVVSLWTARRDAPFVAPGSELSGRPNHRGSTPKFSGLSPHETYRFEEELTVADVHKLGGKDNGWVWVHLGCTFHTYICTKCSNSCVLQCRQDLDRRLTSPALVDINLGVSGELSLRRAYSDSSDRPCIMLALSISPSDQPCLFPFPVLDTEARQPSSSSPSENGRGAVSMTVC